MNVARIKKTELLPTLRGDTVRSDRDRKPQSGAQSRGAGESPRTCLQTSSFAHSACSAEIAAHSSGGLRRARRRTARKTGTAPRSSASMRACMKALEAGGRSSSCVIIARSEPISATPTCRGVSSLPAHSQSVSHTHSWGPCWARGCCSRSHGTDAMSSGHQPGSLLTSVGS